MIFDLILIFLVNFCARIVSTSMGGGGMIVIPFLIFMGLPPAEAIASNRMGAQGISASLFRFHREKLIDWKLGAFLIPPSIIGGVLGSFVVVSIDEHLFKKLIGVVFLISLPFLLKKKKLGIEGFEVSPTRKKIGWVLAMIAAFIGGVFAATGLWFNYVFLYLGLTLLQVAGTRKIIGSAVGLSSLVVLVYYGLINWPVAFVLFLSSVVGSLIGADIAIRIGNVWIKRIFIVVVIVNIVKLVLF